MLELGVRETGKNISGKFQAQKEKKKTLDTLWSVKK